MTLVIAACGEDFIILGTDSRGTIGDGSGAMVAIDIQEKLVKITDSVGIMLFGAAPQAIHIISKFKQRIGNQRRSVMSIAESLAKFCLKETRTHLGNPAEYLPPFGFIIAGVDKSSAKIIPKCFTLKSTKNFSLGLYNHGYEIEGKPIIGYYIFAKEYHANMTIDALLNLVVKALHDTMNVDRDVGGNINLAIIDATGMRDVPLRDIERRIDLLENN